jgi:hypothetical protein
VRGGNIFVILRPCNCRPRQISVNVIRNRERYNIPIRQAARLGGKQIAPEAYKELSMAHTNEVEFVPNGGWDERITVCRNGRLVDVFIITTRRYLVIVDTLINPATAGALWALARERLRAGRQLLVINSHADYDHCWGNSLFAGKTAVHPAPIIGSALSAPLSAYFDRLEEKCRAALARGVPAQPEATANVIALVDCPFVAAAPSSGRWQTVHPYYQTEGHAQQIRMMLASLAQKEEPA